MHPRQSSGQARSALARVPAAPSPTPCTPALRAPRETEVLSGLRLRSSAPVSAATVPAKVPPGTSTPSVSGACPAALAAARHPTTRASAEAVARALGSWGTRLGWLCAVWLRTDPERQGTAGGISASAASLSVCVLGLEAGTPGNVSCECMKSTVSVPCVGESCVCP